MKTKFCLLPVHQFFSFRWSLVHLRRLGSVSFGSRIRSDAPTFFVSFGREVHRSKFLKSPTNLKKFNCITNLSNLKNWEIQLSSGE